ncbi:MAG TPA: DUF6152 family protein [Bryobacteraceae bacterium]|nr:DUF6152 family protein [Bryobacteraceae bacterium]
MKAKFALWAAGAALLAAALPALAHHSFAAEYDASKPITIKGTFVKMDWVNPHSWIRVNVKGEDGKEVLWSCEALPPNGLYRAGWRKNSLKVGDEVVIEGFKAKDGSPTMWSSRVTTADGRRMFAGSPDGVPPSSPAGGGERKQ